MRVDKFLKVSRILKRRSVANNAASEQRVFVNDKAVKPSYKVKVGDILRVDFSGRALIVEVKSLNEKATKEEATSLYGIISEN